MRDRPFLSASESPRPYSEVLAERRVSDPQARTFEVTMARVAELEGAAAAASDATTAKRLQCEAEDLRVALSERGR